ncbi:MAG TPA: adenosylcobinamide-GDP ribazoletransferase [Nocardioidaceae bacterium]|nr:adenosylcobinamide-GDP ribazoletransferase [Nocardioidaceae bacterium]
MTNPLRMALGTLTIVPTPPPSTVDRRVGSWAMTLAPLVGLLLAILSAGALWLLGWGSRVADALIALLPSGVQALLPGDLGFDWYVEPTLTAALVIGLLAVLTRGMHLDGLADTADGLGSRKPAPEALDIMRRGDVGPFGVVTLVLVLLIQVLALAPLVGVGLGPPALLLALVVSRLALPLLCLRGVPAARADGLGQVVVGSVGPGQLMIAFGLAVGVLVPLALLTMGSYVLDLSIVLRAGFAVVLGLGAAALVALRAVRRLGGVTGDVLGAAVEVAFTTVLVVLTVVV